METKEMRIEVPEGYEIDKENSTFECIKFKPKGLTYEDVAKELFGSQRYYIDTFGRIQEADTCIHYPDNNNGTSEKQLEKLLAINKMLNVARFLNENWQPDWNDKYESKWCFTLEDNAIDIVDVNTCCSIDVYFKSKKLAQQAIDILGEDTIRLACSTDW